MINLLTFWLLGIQIGYSYMQRELFQVRGPLAIKRSRCAQAWLIQEQSCPLTVPHTLRESKGQHETLSANLRKSHTNPNPPFFGMCDPPGTDPMPHMVHDPPETPHNGNYCTRNEPQINNCTYTIRNPPLTPHQPTPNHNIPGTMNPTQKMYPQTWSTPRNINIPTEKTFPHRSRPTNKPQHTRYKSPRHPKKGNQPI